MIRGARIELWVEERGGEPAVNPVMQALLEALAGDEAVVSVRVPEREVSDPLGESFADLVLLKSDTDLALSRAVADEMGGARFLNGARETLLVHDKAATVARLAAAGLPVPKTYLFRPDMEDAAQSGMEGRWVVKPVRGVHGRGVSFHEGPALAVPAEIDTDGSFVADDGTRVLQSRVDGGEADLKVYVANGRCFAGRKHFSASSYETDEIEPVVLDPEAEKIVLTAGKTLGLNCFGVDLRFDGERAVIIDANPFPGFRGFQEAVQDLRAEVERTLEAACR
jgi:glutathione synthase/RimK-type ligase-like ATP-grasp enzyme